MVKILVDVASDISAAVAQQRGITLVPAYINFGSETLLSSQISSPEVVERVRRTRKLPTTNEPTEQDWFAAYEEALRQSGGDGVVSLHTSVHLSRSYETARRAAERFGGRVHAVDSGTTTYALGFQAKRAAQLADGGCSTAEILADLNGIGPQQFGYFMADTTDYLRMSGRASTASAFLGNLLGIKPLLRYGGGQVVPAGRPRGITGAQSEMGHALAAYAAQQNTSIRVAYLYTPGGEDNVAALRQLLAGWGYEDAGTHMVGPAMTAVVGPGAIGLAAEAVRPLPKLARPGHTMPISRPAGQ